MVLPPPATYQADPLRVSSITLGRDIVFDALTFTEDDIGREILYTVREVIPDSGAVYESPVDTDITYDTHEEHIKIIVTIIQEY